MGALLLGGPANAQVTSKESESSRRATQQRIKAGEAAKRAQRQRLLEGKDVSYEDVLKDPDNIELNVRFAQTQIRKGNLLGASATLERILLVNPNLVEVRVLYAIVLFRLDNMQLAESELKKAAALNIPDDLKSEIARYLKEIARRKRRTRFSALVNLGYQFDTNRKSSPSSKQLDTILGRAFLTPGLGREPDTAFQGLARLAVEHDLGFQARHQILAAVSFYQADQADLDQFDLQALDVSAGLSYDMAPTTLKPNVYWKFLRLSHQPFLNGYGANIRLDHRYSKALTLFASGQAEHQKYFSIFESPSVDLRTGFEFQATLGATYVLLPTMRLTADLTRIRKKARANFNEYRGYLAALNHTWLLGRGTFLLTHLSYGIDLYDTPDLLVSARRRRDTRYRSRLTFGLPLPLLLFDAKLPAALSDVTVTLSGEFFRSASNITNFTYNNSRISMSITKRVDF